MGLYGQKYTNELVIYAPLTLVYPLYIFFIFRLLLCLLTVYSLQCMGFPSHRSYVRTYI
jgi:hypothetical protein